MIKFQDVADTEAGPSTPPATHQVVAKEGEEEQLSSTEERPTSRDSAVCIVATHSQPLSRADPTGLIQADTPIFVDTPEVGDPLNIPLTLFSSEEKFVKVMLFVAEFFWLFDVFTETEDRLSQRLDDSVIYGILCNKICF